MRACALVCTLTTLVALGAAEPPELAKFATEDAGTVDPGAWEASLGVGHVWSTRAWDDAGTSADRGGRTTETAACLGLKFGLVDHLDIGVGLSWISVQDDAAEDAGDPDSGSGIGDIELGLKYRFYQGEGDHLSAAFVAGAIAPMGRGTSEDRIAVASKYWSVQGGLVLTGWVDLLAWSTAINVLRPLGSGTDETRYELGWDAAIGYQVADWIQPEVEVHHVSSDAVDADDAQNWSLTVGVLIPLEIGRFAGGWTRDLAGSNADQSSVLSASFTTSF